MTPRVWNKKRPNDLPASFVYVGRPSKWGNPFRRGVDGTRTEVIARFEASLRADPRRLAEVRRELRGKHLVCWCAPLPCHADVLLRIANEVP